MIEARQRYRFFIITYLDLAAQNEDYHCKTRSKIQMTTDEKRLRMAVHQWMSRFFFLLLINKISTFTFFFITQPRIVGKWLHMLLYKKHL